MRDIFSRWAGCVRCFLVNDVLLRDFKDFFHLSFRLKRQDEEIAQQRDFFRFSCVRKKKFNFLVAACNIPHLLTCKLNMKMMRNAEINIFLEHQLEKWRLEWRCLCDHRGLHCWGVYMVGTLNTLCNSLIICLMFLLRFYVFFLRNWLKGEEMNRQTESKPQQISYRRKLKHN